MTANARLNERAYDHAKRLVREGEYAVDEVDAWSEHQPSADEENRFIEKHGWSEYGLWHLGLDSDHPPDRKDHYKFPYGDFRRVHRCGVIAAEMRAGRLKYLDIERAASRLHGMIDEVGARERTEERR